MTRPTKRLRVLGTTLMRIAPLLFSEHFLAVVVHPTIADLQSEYSAAGASRLKRLRAQWRGYCAFWMVMLAAPFASWADPTRDEAPFASAGAVARLAVGSAVFALLALTKAMLGISVAVALIGAGALLAILIHAWYESHPTNTSTPVHRSWRSPQINFSATEVSGNIGGLIFVIGSVFVVTIGLPSVRWFLLAACGAGCLVAWRLAAWHARHPKSGLPENLIVLR
jgi:hypothetical protein